MFTAVAWYQGEICSFAVISDELTHDKFAVFVYIKEILSIILMRWPTIRCISLFSDGAASQFKNRFSISAMSIFANMHHVEISWNFFATAHGKGAVDGIGASIKQQAWRLIKAQSTIIRNAQDLVRSLKSHGTKIELLYVESQSIDNIKEFLTVFWSDIDAIHNVQKYHCFKLDHDHVIYCRYYYSQENAVRFNYLSTNVTCTAFLDEVARCSHFSPGNIVLVDYNNTKYPGKVLKVYLTQLQINCMKCIGTNQWIWPQCEDKKSTYSPVAVEKLPEECLLAVGTSKRISHYKLAK